MGHRESFIEVHHIKAMFTIRKLKYTQKQTGFRFSNWHKMIHRPTYILKI